MFHDYNLFYFKNINYFFIDEEKFRLSGYYEYFKNLRDDLMVLWKSDLF